MKFFKLGLLISFGIFTGISCCAQEYIFPLGNNPVVKNTKTQKTKKTAENIMLELPFIDDFSHQQVFPSSDLWTNKYVYINSNYSINPPSIGVATFDAIDHNGSVYPHASFTPYSFNADSLSSQAINLNYPASDSIYLSFFYQAQGNGLAPSTSDSLKLSFFNPSDSSWHLVWSIPGMNSEDTISPFQQVMIPIDTTLFLKEGFRFCFSNKASLPQNDDYFDMRGNVDHWNIDYVRLDRNRHINDTVIRDVALISEIPSWLLEYENVPWTHFNLAYNSNYKGYVSLKYYNNDSTSRNVARSMSVYDAIEDELFNPDLGTSADIAPGEIVSYNINSFYPFNFNKGDKAVFEIKEWLRTDEFDFKNNDTLIRIQEYTDYFAYDDGSAERSYGLRGMGTKNAMVAVKFESFISDSLGGVDIYFTQLFDSINRDYYYKFMVWDDNNGTPGNVIYNGENDYTVEYSDQINKFIRYHFEEPIQVSGTFYVGLLQYNQYMLNIGLDINKNANGKVFYNLGQEWLKSSAPGPLMLRPYMKRSYSVNADEKTELPRIELWPNPASEYIKINIPDAIAYEEIYATIYDITGKIHYHNTLYNNTLNISNLNEGIYFISFKSESQLYESKKIIIRH